MNENLLNIWRNATSGPNDLTGEDIKAFQALQDFLDEESEDTSLSEFYSENEWLNALYDRLEKTEKD